MTDESRNNLVQDESTEDGEKPSDVTPEESRDNLMQDDRHIKDEEKSSDTVPEESPNSLMKDESTEDGEKASDVTPEESPDNLMQDDRHVKDEKKSSDTVPEESPNNLMKDECTKHEKKSEKVSEQDKSEIEKQIKSIFRRPSHLEPRHPIFSSPFARHIAAKAFGPKKPKWYTPLTSAQLYLFKDLVNFIEIGRQGLFNFDAFMEALQLFDSGITRAEVLNILENMEKNEFEELDFGKFLFLLAYKSTPDIKDEDGIDNALATPVVTSRQCLILSAISYYVLIASPEDITRYYIANTRRKASVLHFHMQAARLRGLTEKQMEERLRIASLHLGPLFALTGSPYACPVPFVPHRKKTKIYHELSDGKLSRPRSALPMKKNPIERPITAIKQSCKGDSIISRSKDDKLFYDMHYGRIPMPMLKIPEKMRKEINKKCTVEHKDYITRKAYEAIAEYKDRLKKATVLYNNRSLNLILKKGFPTITEKEDFIEVFKTYMPLKFEDVKNFSLWVKPADYERKHDGRPLYPDNFAFGKKIP